VSLEKASFRVGETIFLLARLRNDSDRDHPVTPLKVSSSDISGNLGIVLSREGGFRAFHPRYDRALLESISPVPEFIPLLEPGKSWIIAVELLAYFQSAGGEISRPGNRIRIGKGSYILQSFYRWDYRPSLVIRSNTLKVEIVDPSSRERWEAWRFERDYRRMLGRVSRESPTALCREAYSGKYAGRFATDLARAALWEGLKRDPIGTIGAFYIIEENRAALPHFLYDLITYWEAVRETEEEGAVSRRFLDELLTRWPGGFLEEVVLQKARFEDIASGKMPRAERTPKNEKLNG